MKTLNGEEHCVSVLWTLPLDLQPLGLPVISDSGLVWAQCPYGWRVSAEGVANKGKISSCATTWSTGLATAHTACWFLCWRRSRIAEWVFQTRKGDTPLGAVRLPGEECIERSKCYNYPLVLAQALAFFIVTSDTE